jgi:zinc transporter ZupT
MRMATLLACATLISTGLGGIGAVRFRDRLHLLLGFSAGAMLGVVSRGLRETPDAAMRRRGNKKLGGRRPSPSPKCQRRAGLVTAG